MLPIPSSLVRKRCREKMIYHSVPKLIASLGRVRGKVDLHGIMRHRNNVTLQQLLSASGFDLAVDVYFAFLNQYLRLPACVGQALEFEKPVLRAKK